MGRLDRIILLLQTLNDHLSAHGNLHVKSPSWHRSSPPGFGAVEKETCPNCKGARRTVHATNPCYKCLIGDESKAHGCSWCVQCFDAKKRKSRGWVKVDPYDNAREPVLSEPGPADRPSSLGAVGDVSRANPRRDPNKPSGPGSESIRQLDKTDYPGNLTGSTKSWKDKESLAVSSEHNFEGVTFSSEAAEPPGVATVAGREERDDDHTVGKVPGLREGGEGEQAAARLDALVPVTGGGEGEAHGGVGAVASTATAPGAASGDGKNPQDVTEASDAVVEEPTGTEAGAGGASVRESNPRGLGHSQTGRDGGLSSVRSVADESAVTPRRGLPQEPPKNPLAQQNRVTEERIAMAKYALAHPKEERWAKAREGRDKRGSYVELERALEKLRMTSPLHSSLVHRVYVTCDVSKERVSPLLQWHLHYALVWLSDHMPAEIRVPQELLDQDRATERERSVKELHDQGFSAGKIARIRKESKLNVQKALRRLAA